MGFLNVVTGFGRVDAYSNAGGVDRAILHGTNNNDTAVFRPDVTVLWAGGTNDVVRARRFERVEVRANGGNDEAKFFDSADADMFVGASTHSQMTGNGFSKLAIGFDHVSANSTAGNDVAKLKGSNGNDKLLVHPFSTRLMGAGYEIEADGFATVSADGRGGTGDRAWLYDSAGDDELIATPTWSQLTGTVSGVEFKNYARNFERVDARSTRGHDTATFYDSAGDDRYMGRPNYAALVGIGFKNVARNFDLVDLQATRGGVDSAFLTGSDGNDTYHSFATMAVFEGTGFRHQLHAGVERIQVTGGTGGKDLMYAVDVADIDIVFGRGNLLRLSRTGNRLEDVIDFDTVWLLPAAAAGPTVDVADIDYSFTNFGG